MERYLIAKTEQGLSRNEIRAACLAALEGRSVKNALILFLRRLKEERLKRC